MTNHIPEQPATPPPAFGPPTFVAPAPPKRRLSPLAAGLIGLIVGAGTVGGIWAVTTNNSPDTFTLEGSFALMTDTTLTDDGGCGGRYDSGYDDIQEGTSVTVYGAKGDVIATGELGESKRVSIRCVFDISVPDVPKGEKFYKVEVSHRGTLQLTAKEAENGEFAGTLG